MKKFFVLLMLLVAVGAHAEDFKNEAFKSASPRFFDKPRVTATAVNFSLHAYDNVSTCRGFGQHDFREVFLPTQSCKGATLMIGGAAFSSLLLERMLYKRHPRLARFPQWLSAAGSSGGIAYTAAHHAIE